MTEPTAPQKDPASLPLQKKREDRVGQSGVLHTPPPILASDVLREDVAPLEPGKRALRFWIVGLGLAVMIVAGGIHLGLLPGGFSGARITYALGGALLGAAVLPFPYSVRGVLIAVVGLAALVLGLVGLGPIAPLVPTRSDLPWEVARATGASCLAGALLFRSRYRAYRGARIALAVSLLVVVPALVKAGMVLATGELAARIGAALVLMSALTSLLGFMGSGTTAASTAWAVVVLVAFSGDVMLRALWLQGPPGWIAHVQAGALFLVATTLVALGGFQLLAWSMAADARRVDVLRKQPPSPVDVSSDEE